MAAPDPSSAPPTPPSRLDDGPAFSSKADAFIAWFAPFFSYLTAAVTYIQTQVQAVVDAGLDNAAQNAADAQAAAGTASNAADEAVEARDETESLRDDAQDYRDQAQAAAAQAAAAQANGWEVVQDLGTVNGSVAVDLSAGTYIVASIDDDVTWSFTNPPPDEAAGGITMELTDASGGTAVHTWPAGTKWPGGAAPTPTSGGTDLLAFAIRTDDASAVTLVGTRALENVL
ncbi:hypothetical protein [Algiphilus sp.]|uniref:hypothetical protein n=1 Tax=Algiphilus sp. TaxID=1872431 RepID=UPI0025C59770|nr:hypothetical protein [Algiphilus sp.]MCK5772049.1 hypothetical protein [Algiphilus sp.]